MATSAQPTLPDPGKQYMIRNIATGTYADMRNGLATEGNPVVGWTNPEPNDHRTWYLEVIDSGANKITLQNLSSGTYARAQPQVKGTAVVGSSSKDTFVLNETPTGSGTFRIQATDQPFSWNLAQGGDDQPINLQQSGTSQNELWAFEEVIQ